MQEGGSNCTRVIQSPNWAFLSICDANRTDQSQYNIINQNKTKKLFSFPIKATAKAHAISVIKNVIDEGSGHGNDGARHSHINLGQIDLLNIKAHSIITKSGGDCTLWAAKEHHCQMSNCHQPCAVFPIFCCCC
jgi:hypothetical protein